MNKEEYNNLSKEILDSAIRVHKEMVPGLLESVYELCLQKELFLRNIKTEQQVFLPLHYRGHELNKEI